jgi:hypothetical protein
MQDSQQSPDLPYRLSADEWLRIVDDDYLRGYIRRGGATVKLVVAEQQTRQHVATVLLDYARRADFVTAEVDARTCKVHLVHNLLNHIAEDVDWPALARDVVRRGLTDRALPPPSGEVLDLQEIADQHGLDLTLVRREMQQMLTERIYKNSELVREMRLAAVQLCLAAAEGTDQAAAMSQNIRDWFCGDLRLVGALKPALIFQKVNRHNARGLLNSLGSWVRLAGKSGLVVVMDITRYLEPASDPADGFRYPKSATIEAYEVVRQFIDGTDEMVGTMLVFLTGSDFQTDPLRGMRTYDALRLRLYDDVRDRSRPNPLSPLVSLH